MEKDFDYFKLQLVVNIVTDVYLPIILYLHPYDPPSPPQYR